MIANLPVDRSPTLIRIAPCLVSLCFATSAFAQSQEVVPPTESADAAMLVRMIEAGINATGVRPAMRDAHAKAHGCVRASFTVGGNLPKNLSVGVFAEPKTYKSWIRFSNGAGTPHDDAAGDGRGMAIKLIGVPGPKLLVDVPEAEPTSQDFVMINHPVFFVRNVADYVPFTALSLQGKSQEFLDKHPHEKGIVDAITSKTVDHVFGQRYFSMAPYLLGDRYIKFSSRPVDCGNGNPIVESTAPPPPNDPNYLRDGMIAWLGEKDACFRLSIQLQTDPATQPVEDPTILWDEAKAPFVDVATIRIPKQTFDSEKQRSFCENLSFTPWHATAEHRPVGGINRLRREVYVAISNLRHKLNKVPSREPTGDETFD